MPTKMFSVQLRRQFSSKCFTLVSMIKDTKGMKLQLQESFKMSVSSGWETWVEAWLKTCSIKDTLWWPLIPTL